jgi:hypothetical protein
MTDEQFSDEEAAVFFECEERAAEVRKAKRCKDPQLRAIALMYLAEEAIQYHARLLEELLEAADTGELELTDEVRGQLVEGIAVAVDRPAWYEPGYRVVLPDKSEDDDGDDCEIPDRKRRNGLPRPLPQARRAPHRQARLRDPPRGSAVRQHRRGVEASGMSRN